MFTHCQTQEKDAARRVKQEDESSFIVKEQKEGREKKEKKRRRKGKQTLDAREVIINRTTRRGGISVESNGSRFEIFQKFSRSSPSPS
jgi:hypothetical protein